MEISKKKMANLPEKKKTPRQLIRKKSTFWKTKVEHFIKCSTFVGSVWRRTQT